MYIMYNVASRDPLLTPCNENYLQISQPYNGPSKACVSKVTADKTNQIGALCIKRIWPWSHITDRQSQSGWLLLV